METELCKLAFKYGSDKCPKIKHHYTPLYFDMFKDRRDSIKKVVEMGIGFKEDMKHAPKHYQTGASLRMWRDFFPNAHIYGADIKKDILFQDDRISTFYCDQTNKGDLKELIKNTGTDIDIFMDDGSHKTLDQAFTCTTLMPFLNKGVTYIIEDINDPYIGDAYFRDYDFQIIETKGTLPYFWDDRLCIVKHK